MIIFKDKRLDLSESVFKCLVFAGKKTDVFYLNLFYVRINDQERLGLLEKKTLICQLFLYLSTMGILYIFNNKNRFRYKFDTYVVII